MKWKLAVVMLMALLLFFGLHKGAGDNVDMPLPAPQIIAAEGKVEAMPGAEMDVGSALTVRIERFLVKVGEHVDKGQVIALLDDKDLAAQLQQAEAELAVAKAKQGEVAAGARREEIRQAESTLQRARTELALAEKELTRNTRLYQDKFMSRAALDSSESAFNVATARVAEFEAQLRLLQSGARRETLALHDAQVSQAEARIQYMRSMLDKTRVTSPISGVLIERYLDAGEVVMPEKPLAQIADTSRLRINAEVDETDAGRLHLGDTAQISAYAYPGQVFRGRVAEIADYVGKREIKPNNPAVNLGLKIIQVKIALTEATPLKLGMTVDVRITPKVK
jgi:ABC exporter DevB family membrane fusion protein